MEGGDFQRAFEYLTTGVSTYAPKRLPAPAAVPEIPARIGASAPIESVSTSGGGIAGPLTEALYSERTFWAERVTETSDGMFSLAWQPLKSIRLIDADDVALVMNFADSPT